MRKSPNLGGALVQEAEVDVGEEELLDRLCVEPAARLGVDDLVRLAGPLDVGGLNGDDREPHRDRHEQRELRPARELPVVDRLAHFLLLPDDALDLVGEHHVLRRPDQHLLVLDDLAPRPTAQEQLLELVDGGLELRALVKLGEGGAALALPADR